MMIKQCSQLIWYKHIPMERAKILYARKKIKRDNLIKEYQTFNFDCTKK